MSGGRIIDPFDMPASAAPRAVALALAELYDTRTVPASNAQPPSMPASEADDAREPEEPGEASLRASFVARKTMTFPTSFLGAALGLQLSRFHTELLYASGEASAGAGDATLNYIVLAVGYDLLHAGTALEVSLRPRLEVGLATARGTAVWWVNSSDSANAIMADSAGAGVDGPRVIRTGMGGPTPERTSGERSFALQAAALAELEVTFEPISSLLLAATLTGGFAHGAQATALQPVSGETLRLGSTGGFVLGATAGVALSF